MVDFISCIR